MNLTRGRFPITTNNFLRYFGTTKFQSQTLKAHKRNPKVRTCRLVSTLCNDRNLSPRNVPRGLELRTGSTGREGPSFPMVTVSPVKGRRETPSTGIP